MSRPTQIRAGSLYEWTETETLQPDETLKARLLLASGTPKAYTVVSNGDIHTITIPATLLAAVTAGRYEQIIYAEKGSGATAEQRYIVDEYIDLLPNAASASAVLFKSFKRRHVEELQETLLKLDAHLATQRTTHGRSWTLNRISDVRNELAIAERELAQEEGGSATDTSVAFASLINA